MKLFSVVQKHMDTSYSVDERKVFLVQADDEHEALSFVKSEHEPHSDDRYEYDDDVVEVDMRKKSQCVSRWDDH